MLLSWAALVLSIIALAVAVGTSLGRQSDNLEEMEYRGTVEERLRKLEGPDEPSDKP